jgi:beta-aspartyl-peptidase (threonine type)
MRKVLAHDIAARIKYRGQSLAAACDELIHGELTQPGWHGGAGLVAIDRTGNVVLPYNTEGMYRGFVSDRAALQVAIYDV